MRRRGKEKNRMNRERKEKEKLKKRKRKGRVAGDGCSSSTTSTSSGDEEPFDSCCCHICGYQRPHGTNNSNNNSTNDNDIQPVGQNKNKNKNEHANENEKKESFIVCVHKCGTVKDDVTEIVETPNSNENAKEEDGAEDQPNPTKTTTENDTRCVDRRRLNLKEGNNSGTPPWLKNLSRMGKSEMNSEKVSLETREKEIVSDVFSGQLWAPVLDR